MLDTVLKAFVKGLVDNNVHQDALREVVSLKRSLHGVYTLVEESRQTKVEYLHL